MNKITHKDLNGIDSMNSNGSVSSKNGIVVSDNGDTLKGSLKDYNGSFSQYTELKFIKGVKKQILEYQIERFQYEDLPVGLDKYRLERKTIENGSGAFVKFGDIYLLCNYTTLTFNMYNEPRKIKINEPKSPAIDGKEFDTELGDAIIFRNNIEKVSDYPHTYRFISAMERILYQIEKSITSSAPKGIINLKGAEFDEDGENPMVDSMEQVVNGQRTFYIIRSKGMEDSSVGDDNGEQLFIPIEFTDHTDSLIKKYTFLKEQIKEIIGAMSNQMQEKKERLVSGEVDTQQPLANSTRQHSFNIRMVDLDKINKRFSLNITMEYQADEREPIEDIEDKGDNDE